MFVKLWLTVFSARDSHPNHIFDKFEKNYKNGANDQIFFQTAATPVETDKRLKKEKNWAKSQIWSVSMEFKICKETQQILYFLQSPRNEKLVKLFYWNWSERSGISVLHGAETEWWKFHILEFFSCSFSPHLHLHLQPQKAHLGHLLHLALMGHLGHLGHQLLHQLCLPPMQHSQLWKSPPPHSTNNSKRKGDTNISFILYFYQPTLSSILLRLPIRLSVKDQRISPFVLTRISK